MARGGTGGGGHSSGGHSGGSHSSSGHRASSGGSRGSGVRGGLSSRSSSPPRPSYSPPPIRRAPPPPPRRGHGYGPHPPRRRRHSSSTSTSPVVSAIITVFVIILIIIAFVQVVGGFGGSYSTEKHQGLGKTSITPLASYRTDCVVDEDNWFVDPYRVGQQLEPFYKKTGIQPWVVIKSPEPGLITDSQKQQWADNYYRANIPHEGTLLYVYFAETNPDVAGYSTLTGGASTRSFFDTAAMDAFWDVYDSYYYNPKVTEEQLIVNTFLGAAEICLSTKTVTISTSTGVMGIMSKVIPFIIIGGIVLVALIVVYRIMKARHARAAAEAAETERILNTPLEQLGSKDDSLADKYL